MTDYNTSDYTNVSSHLDDSIFDIFSERNELKNKNSGWKKSQVWDFFETEGAKKHGHTGCICKGCGWKIKVRKAHEMVEHLALTCTNVTGEVKDFFMQELKERNKLKFLIIIINLMTKKLILKKKENYHLYNQK